jgi:hypothetical protein
MVMRAQTSRDHSEITSLAFRRGVSFADPRLLCEPFVVGLAKNGQWEREKNTGISGEAAPIRFNARWNVAAR